MPPLSPPLLARGRRTVGRALLAARRAWTEADAGQPEARRLEASTPVDRFDHVRAYSDHVAQLLRVHDEDTAMHLAVGGNWQAMGQLERDLVIYAGLQPHHTLVDIGCGSGRLAVALQDHLTGTYVGTDLVEPLLAYARRRTTARSWRFELVDGFAVPMPDSSVDMVCAFSVFTHLLHEETYLYLEDAARSLKPGGTLVFSFLEFRVRSHWAVFESMLAAVGSRGHHNQFLSRDAIEAFAAELGFEVVEVHDGNVDFIPLSRPAVYDDGRVFETSGQLGQSVCILRRSAASAG